VAHPPGPLLSFKYRGRLSSFGSLAMLAAIGSVILLSLLPMKPDARVSDVLDTLSNPIEYVRGIVESFVEYQFDKTASRVRIGISGNGIVPNYIIETPRERDPTVAGIQPEVSKRHIFNGRNHREFLDDRLAENWSSEGMTFSEVQALLGLLREIRRRGR
jgi:hypothetical protein